MTINKPIATGSAQDASPAAPKKRRVVKSKVIPFIGQEVQVVSISFEESASNSGKGFERENKVLLEYHVVTPEGPKKFSDFIKVNKEFELIYRNGIPKVDFKKKAGVGREVTFYTPGSVFMESSDSIREFLKNAFKSGKQNAVIFTRGTGEKFFQFDVDFDAIEKKYTPFSAAAANKRDQYQAEMNRASYNAGEKSFINSVLQKNALDFIVNKDVQQFFVNKAKESVSATSMTNEWAAAKKESSAVMRAIHSSNPDDHMDAIAKVEEAFSIENEEAELLVASMRSEFPLDSLSSAKKEGKLKSAHFIQIVDRFNRNMTPYVDLTISNLDELKSAESSPVSWAKDFAILSVGEMTEHQKDKAGADYPFLMKISDADERFSDVNRGSVAGMLQTSGLFGNYGAASVQRNAIANFGDMTDSFARNGKDFAGLADHLFEGKDSILKKWVGRIDISTPAGKNMVSKLSVNKDGNGVNAFFIKSPFDENHVYAFCSKAMGKEISFGIAKYPHSEMIIQNIPDGDNFLFSAYDARGFSYSGIAEEDEGLLLSSDSDTIERIQYNFAAAREGFSYSLMYRENTEKAIEAYLSNINKHSSLSSLRNELILDKCVKNIASSDITREFSANNIPEDLPVFPDLLNIFSGKKQSLKEIASNPIMTAKYLQMPGIAETVKGAMEQYGYKVPSVQEFLYDLVDHNKNILDEDRKDKVISSDDNMGILNYKYVPPYISINTDEAKAKFFDICKKVVIEELEKAGPISDAEEASAEEKMQTIVNAMAEGSLLSLKAETTYDQSVGLFKQKEQFIVMNEDYVDIAAIQIPPMKIYEEMRKSAGLTARNRTSSIKAKDSVMGKIFASIYDFTEKFYSDKKDKIDDVAIALIHQALSSGVAVDKDKLYDLLLKKSKIETLAKEVLGARPKFPEIVEASLKYGMSRGQDGSFNPLTEKDRIVRYLKENFVGKEKEFFFGRHSEGNKLSFNETFMDTDYIETLWSGMSSIASYDNMLATASTKVFEMLYFREMIHFIAKEQGIENPLDLPSRDLPGDFGKSKDFALNYFLKVCLGLSQHQAKEVKGFILMHIGGYKNTELLFWEMRTGKTRAALATLMLLSMYKKSDSVFFVQNKNFDDIIMQAWDMQPLLVSEMALFMGDQTRFNVKNFSTSMPLSKSVFPNMPVVLKKMLKNPIHGSELAPAEYLSKDFVRDFEIIKSAVMKHDNPLSEAMANDFSKEIPFFLDNEIAKRNDTVSLSLISTFYYIKKLHSDGFIELTPDVLKKLKKNVVGTTFANLAAEEDRLKEKRDGSIIFAGKQYIDSFAANNKQSTNLFEKEMKTHILSDIDVVGIEKVNISDDVISHPSEIDEVIDYELSEVADSILIPASIHEKAQNNQFVLPYVASMGKKEKEERGLFQTYFSAYKKIEGLIYERLSSQVDQLGDAFLSDSFDVSEKEVMDAISSSVKSVIDYLYENLEIGDFASEENIIQYGNFENNIGESIFGTAISLTASQSIDAAIERKAKQVCGKNENDFTAWVQKNIIKTEEVATILSHEFYKGVFVKMLSGHRLVSSKIRLASAFGTTQAKADGARFSIEFKGSPVIYAPARRIKAGDKQNKLLEYARIGTIAANKKDPSIFTKEDAYVQEVEYEILPTKGGAISRATITKASYKDENGQFKEIVRQSAKVSQSLNATTYWENEPRGEVAVVSIDEGHKNASASKGFQAKSMLNSISERFPGSAKAILSGSPLAKLSGFANLMETISGSEGAKFEKSIKKHCGNFKFNSEFLGVFFHLASTDLSVSKLLEEFIEDMEDKPLLVGDTAGQLTSSTKAMFEKTWEHQSVKDALSGKGSISGDLHINYYDAQSDFFELMGHVEKSIARLIGTKKELTSDVFWSAAEKMTSDAPGFSNPTALASFFDFISGANTSIRRPSNDIEYRIMDKESVYVALSGGVSKDASVSKRGSSVLLADLAITNYRRRFFLSQIKTSIMSITRGVAQAMRENPELYGFKDTQSALTALNRSQSSVNDGIEDLVDTFLTKKQITRAISHEKEVLLDRMLKVIAHAMDKNSEIQSLVAEAGELGEKTFSVMLGGDVYEIETKHGAGFKGMFHGHGGSPIQFAIDDSMPGNIFLKGGELYVADKNKKVQPLTYEFNFSYSVEDWIPDVDFTINAASVDDKSIMEVAAFLDKTISLSLDSANKGENQRIMTTRVAITNMAVAAAVSSACARKDKTRTAKIIVNSTDNRTDAYLEKLKTIAPILESNGVKIEKSTSITINAAFEIALDKKEQIYVVGNYESLAEGFDMEFVDIGFYLGAVDKTAAATQSFARQIGHNKKVSSFYLNNGGNLYSYKGGGGKSLSDINAILDGRRFSDDTSENTISLIESMLNVGTIEKRPSYCGKTNGAQMLDLMAYEHFMGGAFAGHQIYSEEEIASWLTTRENPSVATLEAEIVEEEESTILIENDSATSSSPSSISPA